MTTIMRAIHIPAAELEESLLAPPSAQPLSGDITVRSRLAFSTADKKVLSGVWESEPGVSRWEFTNRGEIITVVEGRMTVAEDGKDEVQISAGDSAYFPVGWTGTWTVHERLRKVFVVYAA